MCVLNSITDQQQQQQQRHFLALCYLKREYTESETVSCLAIGHFACHTLSFSGALCLLGWLGERMKERERAKRCVSDGKPPPLLLLLLLALMMDDEHTAIHWQKQCTTATATTAIISVQQTGQNVAVSVCVCIYRRYRELTPELSSYCCVVFQKQPRCRILHSVIDVVVLSQSQSQLTLLDSFSSSIQFCVLFCLLLLPAS